MFHIPLNIGVVILRNTKKIVAAEALPKEPPMMLFDENSLWDCAKHFSENYTVLFADNKGG